MSRSRSIPRAPDRSAERLLRVAVAAVTVVLAMLLPRQADAQLIVSGRVTVSGIPVEGATVGIPSLRIESRTAADGSYNFLVRTAQVSGQTVELVARHRRFGSRSVRIALTGSNTVHNFALASGDRPDSRTVAARPDTVAIAIPSGRRVEVSQRRSPRTVDSTAFAEIAGSPDVASALAGRIPGLTIIGASAPGGTSLMVFRGARSLSGSIQPLVVLDGVPLETGSTASGPAQPFGLGGFDYGSPLQDLSLSDIATVRLMDAAEAAPLYGSRAANGVLAITTKRAGGDGFNLASRVRISGHSATRLPSYQNSFGQGLGGQFEFFDGEGGGINDGVDQSWGPALDGRPITQASLTESRFPDVRYWLPQPDGVRNYFEGGPDIDANVSVQAVRGAHQGRVSLTANNAHGMTPRNALQRLGAALNGTSQLSSRISATASLQAISRTGGHRPGSGFDEVNPVAGFTRMGRQVDLDALRHSRRDGADGPINWIYGARNNPYFQSLENSNEDKATHLIGGARLSFGLASWLSATAHAGIDDVEDRRSFQVVHGWLGGYPTAVGRADFLGGGSQSQNLSVSDLLAGVSVNAVSRWSGLDASATAGFDTRKSRYETRTSVTTGAVQGQPSVVVSDDQSGSHDLTAIYLTGKLSRGSLFSLNAGVRVEQSASFADELSQAVFPSVSMSYDAAQAVSAIRSLGLGTARLRASWWRAGSDVTTRTLARAYAGGGTSSSPTLGLTAGDVVPERTSGIELGTEIATPGARLALDLTAYQERSSQVLIGTLGGQSAEVFNNGVELQLRAVPISAVIGPQWDVVASFSSNTSTVEALAGGVVEAPLGPPIWGAWLTARTGHPVGTIVGSKYLRSADGQLLLGDGLPMSDGSLSVLGSWQPDWTASLENRVRFGRTELAILFDARVGGKLFSATNLWGSYAGTLESTVSGRDGMTIPGRDSLTGGPNTTEVTAEDYFHSLASIHEAWVFDASYAKLREARITYEVPLTFLPGFRGQVGRLSLTGRNLVTFAKAPNIDPETALSSSGFQGFEMGQLPGTRSLGFVLIITP